MLYASRGPLQYNNEGIARGWINTVLSGRNGRWPLVFAGVHLHARIRCRELRAGRHACTPPAEAEQGDEPYAKQHERRGLRDDRAEDPNVVDAKRCGRIGEVVSADAELHRAPA